MERFGVIGPDGVNLLVMGTLTQPAAGCLCPENSLLSAVIDSLRLRRGEAILLDTQAGVEHFGRALAKGFRHAAVVTDPTFNGVSVAVAAARMAHEIGIGSVHLIVNRVRNGADVDKVRRLVDEEGGFDFASEHALPWDETLLSSEPAVDALSGRPAVAAGGCRLSIPRFPGAKRAVVMRVVIIGAGPAGLTVAETVRQKSPTTDITLLSVEPFPPYAPPAIADHFLTGRTETLFWKGEDVCERLGLDYRSGVGARSVDTVAHRVRLDDSQTLEYDRLVIATGGRLYAPVEGSELPGIANFKSLRAAKQLVERAKRGEAKSALIVGAGFIGVEVALVLRDLGLQVTLVEALDRVMPRMLDAETAEIVQREIEKRGVTVRLSTRVAAFGGHKRAENVSLESGEVLTADIYVAATGVKPNLEPIEDSAISARWGIVVDDRLRTSAPRRVRRRRRGRDARSPHRRELRPRHLPQCRGTGPDRGRERPRRRRALRGRRVHEQPQARGPAGDRRGRSARPRRAAPAPR